jgi:hypothetical protein
MTAGAVLTWHGARCGVREFRNRAHAMAAATDWIKKPVPAHVKPAPWMHSFDTLMHI